jgi:hypothetical protein
MRYLRAIIGNLFFISFVFLSPNLEAQALRQPVPAKIASVDSGTESVGFTTHSGTIEINADIGRWDTPYPYPDTGEFAPGLQPTGYSTMYIDVDVNDGGIATFRYSMRSYDAGIYDWYDITLETPTETIPIVSRLGKPGREYGNYWESANIPITQSLDKWRNQRVRFVFRVMQDGWGDQTQGSVINFRLSTCDIPPLTPLQDPAAIEFENGNRVVLTGMTPGALQGVNCMRNRVGQLGGNFQLQSAFRPPTYQTHLREVWDTWMAIRNRNTPDCDALKQVIGLEFTNHALLLTQRPAAGSANSPHAQGIAFDAGIRNLSSPNTVDTVAAECGMYRPWATNDPVHYQPR